MLRKQINEVMAERDIIARLVVEGASQFVQETQKAATAEEQLNQAIKENTTVQDQNAKKTVSARQELKNLREELIQLERQGKRNTAEYKKLEVAAGELDDAIGDVNARLKQSGSDTRGLDKALRAATVLTGGFTALEGATALFGKESENLQKSLLKVQGALAILNGLQEIQTELARTDNIFTSALTKAKLAYAAAVGTATGATKAFRLALIATGIGAAVVAIGLLVANWDKLTAAIQRAFPGLAKFGAKVAEIVQSVTDFVGITSEQDRATAKLVKTLEAQNKELERQKALADAQGNKAKAFELEQKILKNQLEILKAQGAEEQDILDAQNAILVSEAEYQKSLEDSKKKTDEKKKKEEEVLGVIEKLNVELKKVNEAIGNIDVGDDANLVIKLFGEKADLEQRIKSLQDLFAAYEILSKTQLINPAANEDIKTLEENIGLVNQALNQLDTDAPQRTELVLLFQRLNEQLVGSKNNLEQLKKDAQTGPQIPETWKIIQEDIAKAAKASDDYFAKEAENKIKSDELALQEKNRRIKDAQEIANQSFAIFRKFQDARLTYLENQLKQGLITEEEFEKKSNEIRRRAAIADKLQTIFNATLQVFQAFGKGLVTGGPGAAIAYKALALFNLAAAIATPIPKFFKGVKNFMGGLAWVGDGGKREPITSASGELLGVSPDKPTLVNLPKGANVYKDIPTFKKEANIAYLPTPSLALPTLKENKQLKSLERAMKKNGQKLEDLILLSKQGNLNTRQGVNELKTINTRKKLHRV